MISESTKALAALMLQYGYVVRAGNEIWSTPIASYPGSFFGHCRDVFDAAEQLCPIIRDADYTDNLIRLTSPA